MFQSGYDNACMGNGDTQASINDFVQSVESHILIGYRIVSSLLELPLFSPPPSHPAWGDFMVVSVLLSQLHQRIAILEAMLDILALQVAQESEMVSGVHKYNCFIDRL